MSVDNQKIDIIEILKNSAVDNKLQCSKLFEIINQYSFFPDIVGFSLNKLNIKITHCQLGLFGYAGGKNIPKCETVSEKFENKIFDYMEDGRLPCAAAWNIASEMKISKLDVTSACEKLNIKINKCQLGAF